MPEERLGHGAVPDMSLWENGFLSAATRMELINNGFIQVGASSAFAERVVEEFRVKTPGVTHDDYRPELLERLS